MDQATAPRARNAPPLLASVSREHDVGVMGMHVAFENGTPTGFVILERDATELHGHLTSHGVRIIKGLRDADYGLRGFVFADPDGRPRHDGYEVLVLRRIHNY